MSVSVRKKFAIFFAMYILVMSLHLPLYKAYADSDGVVIEYSVLNGNEDEIYINENARNIGFLLPYVSVSVTSFLKILQIFALALVTMDSWEYGIVDGISQIIKSIQRYDVKAEITEMLTDCANGVSDKVSDMTLLFLVAYGKFNNATGLFTDSFRTELLKVYNTTFVNQLETDFSDGITFDDLKKYGVTSLFSASIFQELYDYDNSIVGFPSIGGSSYSVPTFDGVGVYRTCNTNEYPEHFRVKTAPDLNMDLVEKVQITRSNIGEYNYGWDGLTWTQQYYLKTAKDGLQYMLAVVVGKSLSTNQRLDQFFDGCSFGLYQVNELGEIVREGINNAYYSSTDMRNDVTIPRVGLNLYTSSAGTVDFNALRDICVDLWGADLFPSVPDVFDGSTTSFNERNSITDYSKNEPGVYDNAWNKVGSKPLFPLPGLGDLVKFPTLNPGQSAPSIPTSGNPTWDDVFTPDAFPQGGTITTPQDWVTDTDVPGVDNPDIPGSDDGTGTPSVSWDWLKVLLGNIGLLIESILDWLDGFWDTLLEFFKSLLVPTDTYFTDNFNDVTVALKEKIPDVDIEKLEDLAVGESTFKDIYADFFGVRCLVIRGSVINNVISWARPIIQGLIVLFLLLYNYNQIYYLIRGTSLYGASNTIDNMNNNRIGGIRR